MDRTASDFFDADGVFAKTMRLVLRKPEEGDFLDYIDTFLGGLCKEYRREDDSGEYLRASYWGDSFRYRDTPAA